MNFILEQPLLPLFEIAFTQSQADFLDRDLNLGLSRILA